MHFGGCCGAAVAAGVVPLNAVAHLQECIHLSFLWKPGSTKALARAKPACGKCGQQGFAGPACITGMGTARGCWKALQGWRQVVHDRVFIPALIMPLAASLCNSQLCVLQLA